MIEKNKVIDEKIMDKESNKSKLNIAEKSLLLGFICSILFSMLSFTKKCENISNKIFRLHIMANSDSFDDQKVKLKIRDEILKCFCRHNNFEIKDLCDAKEKTTKNLELIKKEIISNFENKLDIDLKVRKNYFNTRIYEDFTLPAGIYDALCVKIGKGEGKNWWCIVFPPMCLPAAIVKIEDEEKKINKNNDETESIGIKSTSTELEKNEIKLNKTKINDKSEKKKNKKKSDKNLKKILTKKELSIIKNPVKYEIKFKVIDYYEYIKNKIQNLVINTYNCFNSKKNSINKEIKNKH